MRNLKIYLRNLKRQKLIYGITIGGFAISLAVLVVISSYILEEKSVDKHLPNIDRMYRIKQDNQNGTVPKRIYQTLLDNAPEIENLTLFKKNGTLFEYGTKKDYLSFVSANDQFLDIFSIQILQGEVDGLLQAKTDVLITEEFAQRVFGDKNPIGEIIEFGNNENKQVKAVIANPLKTSSLKYDVIFNLDQKINQSYRGYNQERYYLYDAVFTLRAGANSVDVEKKITDILKIYDGYDKTSLEIQPFKDIYFDTKGDNDSYSHANLDMIKLLSWIAFIILTLAVLNYINLTTAFNNERHREICIRKTSGARNITIFKQFIGESFFSFGIALILATGLAILSAPVFKALLGRTINISEALQSSEMILLLVVTFLFVGTVSGFVPALIVSKFNPIDLLQRNIKLRNSEIRGVYNTIQIAVSLLLIISLIVITKQIKYVKTKDVGFDKELLLEVGLQGRTYEKASSIKEELLKHPQILNVSGTHGRPFGTYASSSGTWKHDSLEYKIDGLYNMNTDTSFLSTFGLKLIKGRNFRPTDKNACIINQKTYNYLQLEELAGINIFGSELIGVVEDFHFKKMHTELGFIKLMYNPQEISHLNIKILGYHIPETVAQIENTFKEFEPNWDFNPRFYNDWINTMYQKEERQARTIKIYALIAIILSCLGLIGMAEFSSIKRTKEIGIRKVNGAKVSEILAMLNKDFVKWVMIAFIIATPIAYYAMNKWLENFAYKTSLSWWIFALAGLLALGIALLTVSFQSWKAASKNPIESLRYE